MSRPTFAHVIDALRITDPRFPWVGPTPQEAEAAVVLEALEATHQPRHDEGSPCTGCGQSWPCEAWGFGEQTAVQWLGRAADRVHLHADNVYRARRSAS